MKFKASSTLRAQLAEVDPSSIEVKKKPKKAPKAVAKKKKKKKK